jgi:outer membrane usher protein
VPIHRAGLGRAPIGDALSYAARSDAQDKTLSLGTDLRLFTPYGTGVNYGVLTVQDGVSDYIRQDTYWTYSGVQSMRNYTAGDFISSSLIWTRSVRMGGMQVARDFDIRPDLITFPLPELGSTAVVPTTVDLYVNGMRQFQGSASGGPFVIAAPPSLTGAGNASIVYQDELGRDVVTMRRMYVDTRMMDKGLADYSLEAGYLRQAYGTLSSLYADHPVASASLRYGVHDRFTLEGHGEWGRGVSNGGIGGLLQVGALGVLSGAVAVSSSDGSDTPGRGRRRRGQRQADQRGLPVHLAALEREPAGHPCAR